ncbi:hypothetical protein GCM10023091_15240 [Ravibacter arvi]|uniref:Methyltransferase domain-containing protein n=1 Tax=Ravibacter arvi TaxID=2051041 RepID=A0ABP8LW16_9BACT
MKKETDFNLIAPVYYPLSRLVFGGAQEKAQAWFAPSVSPSDKVLIVGAGNGAAATHFPENEVFLVEPSSRMIRLARRTNMGRTKIHFYQGTIEQFLGSSHETFDTILTAFFFDLFPQEKAEKLFVMLDKRLRTGGTWIFADFQAGTTGFLHRLLLNTMYRFFSYLSHITASEMPEMKNSWRRSYHLYGQKHFFHRLIVAQLWKKDRQEYQSSPADSSFSRRL